MGIFLPIWGAGLDLRRRRAGEEPRVERSKTLRHFGFKGFSRLNSCCAGIDRVWREHAVKIVLFQRARKGLHPLVRPSGIKTFVRLGIDRKP